MSNFSHGEGLVPANVRATMLNKKTHWKLKRLEACLILVLGTEYKEEGKFL